MTSRTEDPEHLFNAAYDQFGDEAAIAVSNSINGHLGAGRNAHWPPTNLHLGTSIENRNMAALRGELLRATPAAVRFFSVEPLLEDLGVIELSGIHWVIVGGESGPGSRPCNVNWILQIIEQCRAASVPVFVKQLGRNIRTGVNDDLDEWGSDIRYSDEWDEFGMPIRTADSKGGDWSEWPEDLRVREFPQQETAG
jgi:Protein of unknown function (DUF5131)